MIVNRCALEQTLLYTFPLSCLIISPLQDYRQILYQEYTAKNRYQQLFVNDDGEHCDDTAGWILFVIVTIIVVTAVSNGANLNDGMDGMAAGNSAIIGATLGILAYVSSHIEFAGYLNIMYIPGSEELVIYICAFIGALIGFLWYNAYPAQVFMGDTGSLTIGGIIAVFAIIIHKELQDYRQILYQEYTAKNRYQQLFVNDDGEHCDDTANGEAACVSHKYLCRISIVP